MKNNILKAAKFLALGCALTLSVTSCSNWLDVNNDPDNPNSSSAVVENRLPWIQRGYMYTTGVTNMRSSAMAGAMYSTNANVGNSACAWDCRAGLTTTPYQSFFCMCGNNLKDMEVKAEEDGSTHYVAAAKVVRAMAFMNMLDLYGEMPMSHAFMNEPTPVYDNGKQIYEQCLAELDEAIKLFSEPQKEGATPLARGDMWCGGDAQRWLGLCHGLKARYMMRLTKRADWNADAVIAEATQFAEGENVVQKCYNVAGEVTDWLMGDPIQTNGNWNYTAYGHTQRIGKFYYDKLANARGAGVEDPRLSKIVPAVMYDMTLDANGVVTDCKWFRSKPVDVYDDAENRLKAGVTTVQLLTYADKDVTISYKKADGADAAFIAARIAEGHAVAETEETVDVTYKAGTHYINSPNPVYVNDWKYVSLISASTSTGTKLAGAPQDANDLNYYAQKSSAARAAGAIASTGSYQVRSVSDFEIMCYDEVCFILAECYMRKSDAGQAYNYYKKGIEAHFARMQKQLTEWQGIGYKTAAGNNDMEPMDDAAISAYMASAAVAQGAGELTMKDIMEQKYIALGFRLENWNDVRRFNYSVNGEYGVVYPGIHRPAMFTGNAIKGTAETDPMAWPRRFRLPASLELQYNANEALAINPHAMDEDIWSYPVWWDCTSDAEYENYLK